jgi:hypothetical protein
MRFLSYFHDPDDLFVPILSEIKLPEELKGSIVAVTPETTIKVYELVKNLGFKIIEGGPYGYARIAALRESLKLNDSEHFFVCDFDKMLHWLTSNREEFLSVMRSVPKEDLTVVARGPHALATYPKSWVETEQIAAKILAKVIGQEVDLMNGPYILNKKAAEIIVSSSVETGVGSCAEWCILAKQGGLSIGNMEVEGLTWEDPDRYTSSIAKYTNLEDWKEATFDSLYEWRKRVEFLHKQVQVMIRLNEEPVNPKYPVVKNRIFSSSTVQ